MDPPIRIATPEPLHRHCAPASPPETIIFGKNEAGRFSGRFHPLLRPNGWFPGRLLGTMLDVGWLRLDVRQALRQLARVARVHLRHADHSLRRHRREHRDLQSRTRSPPAAVALSGPAKPSRSGGESLARSSRLLRATPQLGRVFTDADAVDGAHRIVLLIHSTGRTGSRSDPDIVGLNDEPYVVVGVLSDGFEFPTERTELLDAPRRRAGPGAGQRRSRPRPRCARSSTVPHMSGGRRRALSSRPA